MKTALFLLLAAVGAAFGGAWAAAAGKTRRAIKPPADPREAFGLPRPMHGLVGFVTNFFDTLGIGSFASTTSVWRLLGLVPDRLIPGTLLVGHAPATLAQAFIYITIIKVEMATLVLLIGAAVAGAYLGADVVAGWPRRKIQVGMGVALLVAAVILVAQAWSLLPAGGATLGLGGVRLAIGLAGNFMLGALMTLGIGAYAPSLVLFALLGMNVKSIFPIMMGSCAFLMPVGGIRFVRRGAYAPRAALGLALGGVPAVLLAAYVVRELDLRYLRWLVVAVVVYTAVAMLRSALRDTPDTAR